MKLRDTALLASLIVSATICQAQELKGARNAVEQMLAAPKTASAVHSAFQRDLDAFLLQGSKLPPDQAGKAWVALLSQALSADKEGSGMYSGGDSKVASVLLALPEPKSWPAIQVAAKGMGSASFPPKQKAGIDFLTALLVGDRPAQERSVISLLKGLDASNPESLSENSDVIELYKLWSASVKDKVHIKRSLTLAYTPAETSETYLAPEVLLLDPADREEVAKLYFSKNRSYYEPRGVSDELKAFFSASAVKYGKTNNAVVWQSLAEFGTTARFEDYCRKNGKFLKLLNTHVLDQVAFDAMGNTENQGKAVAYYAINLAIDGRSADAEQVLVSAPKEFGERYLDQVDLEGSRSLKSQEKIALTLSNVLSRKPDASYWGLFTTVSQRAAKGDLLVATAQKALAAQGASQSTKQQINDALARGYLAIDRTDDAVALMVASLSATARPNSTGAAQMTATVTTLMEIGVLLKRSDLVDSAIKALDSLPERYSYFDQSSVAKALMSLGRYSEAEEMLVNGIVASLKKDSSPYESMYGSGHGSINALFDLYLATGKYQDAVYLLQNAPIWSWTDLSHALTGGSSDIVFGAARALAKLGRKDEALKLATAGLYQTPGNDRGYEVLAEVEGADAIPTLDKLFQLDQFEERPLIWKAKLLYDQGDYQNAEAVARQAIAIDPSDGEQGKGDRMRVYAVLSDILRKQGEAQQADLYANAVKAIRISEDADDFYAVGMTSRAIKMYETALSIFEDAYCIQSRLAVQLLESGHPDEAAAHFRKAFELMPDSFGRIESHCFGCEHVFESPQAQDIALSVLQQLNTERPDKPQVPYLMGYLLNTRGQFKEAATYLEKAVHLDPKYLNAWILLDEVYSTINAPSANRERATMAIASLDPLRRHSQSSYYDTGIQDYAKLWMVGNDFYQKTPRVAESLFELTGTKKKRESMPKELSDMISTDYSRGDMNGPASVLLANPLVRAATSLILQGGLSEFGFGGG